MRLILSPFANVEASNKYSFHQVDICDGPAVLAILTREKPAAIIHLAAETHVDRSIDGPAVFVQTNVVGTVTLLNAALDYWRDMGAATDAFRFHHVSTDEVFGDLPLEGGMFTEDTPYAPSSPYSASKAASDHFVRAWHETYGLPIVLSNCSNNYGPFPLPRKANPARYLERPRGSGASRLRRWARMYVTGCMSMTTPRLWSSSQPRAKLAKATRSAAVSERDNLTVVETICDILDFRVPLSGLR